MVGDADCYGFGVFLVDGLRGVFKTCDEVCAVHDVGFKKDHGALVESIGEEIARPYVRGVSDFLSVWIFWIILIRGKLEFLFELFCDGFGEGDFDFCSA